MQRYFTPDTSQLPATLVVVDEEDTFYETTTYHITITDDDGIEDR
jgi:hypothetical protein